MYFSCMCCEETCFVSLDITREKRTWNTCYLKKSRFKNREEQVYCVVFHCLYCRYWNSVLTREHWTMWTTFGHCTMFHYDLIYSYLHNVFLYILLYKYKSTMIHREWYDIWRRVCMGSWRKDRLYREKIKRYNIKILKYFVILNVY